MPFFFFLFFFSVSSGINSLIITLSASLLYVQGAPQLFIKHEDIRSSISPPATPGRDTDGGGRQEVRPPRPNHESRPKQQKAAHTQSKASPVLLLNYVLLFLHVE